MQSFCQPLYHPFHASGNASEKDRARLLKNLSSRPKRLRSCFEFISEAIGGMFLMILFHHLTSIASYVRINDGTKGQKQAPIDPK